MTHSDIYTKFMIEYDKANITSSYPSLTKYEIATILDKAYLALIAQKYTGNNPRRSAFESDMKAIEDLQPLIKSVITNGRKQGDNCYEFHAYLGNTVQYIVDLSLMIQDKVTSQDDGNHNIIPVNIVDHEVAKRFKSTINNMPWIKEPVGCIEGKTILVYVDPSIVKINGSTSFMEIRYIQTPAKFVIGPGTSEKDYDFGNTWFELSDGMAEELINLAIIMSTEIVESSRLTSKINTRPLES